MDSENSGLSQFEPPEILFHRIVSQMSHTDQFSILNVKFCEVAMSSFDKSEQ